MHNRILVAMEQYTLLQHPFLSDTCAYRRLSHNMMCVFFREGYAHYRCSHSMMSLAFREDLLINCLYIKLVT